MTERSAAEQEMDLFIEAYNRFPAASQEFRLRWAHRIVKSTGLQVAYSLTGPVLDGKYAAEDYLNDTDSKRANGMGVPW